MTIDPQSLADLIAAGVAWDHTTHAPNAPLSTITDIARSASVCVEWWPSGHAFVLTHDVACRITLTVPDARDLALAIAYHLAELGNPPPRGGRWKTKSITADINEADDQTDTHAPTLEGGSRVSRLRSKTAGWSRARRREIFDSGVRARG